MKRIILLRHGVTQENQAGVIQGQMDGHLTEQGREQARAAGRHLSQQRIDRAVTSDLARARDTLLEVLKFVDCPWTTDVRLRERSFGRFHGWSYGEYVRLVENSEHQLHTFRPPNGEDYIMFHQRVTAFLDDTETIPGDESLLIVTHGGVVGHLLTHAQQRPLTDVGQFHTDNASITELLITDDGSIDVARMNDTSYLVSGP